MMRKYAPVSAALLVAAALSFSCQSNESKGVVTAGDAAVAAAASNDEVRADTFKFDSIFVDPGRLNSTAAIEAWVRHIDKQLNKLRYNGSVTIPRTNGNFEVSAYLSGGEIVLLHTVTPGNLGQQWYYLNRYLLPAFREMGRTPQGEYFERRFYYTGVDALLAARERRAASQEELADAPWRQYRPEGQGDFRIDAEAARRSAIDFISGK